MSKLEKQEWGGYEYTSNSGIVYEIGEVSSEYNVIVDNFMDISELFDANILIHDKLVDYVFGNLMNGSKYEIEEIKQWIDDRIFKYENYERTVRFYRNVMGSEDSLYECYLGLEDEEYEEAIRISAGQLLQMAREDKN